MYNVYFQNILEKNQKKLKQWEIKKHRKLQKSLNLLHKTNPNPNPASRARFELKYKLW